MAQLYELFKDLYQKVEVSGMSAVEQAAMDAYCCDRLDCFIIKCDSIDGPLGSFDIVLFMVDGMQWDELGQLNHMVNPRTGMRINLNGDYHTRISFTYYDSSAKEFKRVFSDIFDVDGNRVLDHGTNIAINPRVTYYAHLAEYNPE